jgi:cullin-associated NEDD8-dissociated protein 1
MADRAVLNGLLVKLDDPDPDLRYMSLNDLLALLKSKNSNWLLTDSTSSGRVSDGLLKALKDQNGEVQNMALKW